jgi:Skp family chaperone for outer membrane proteins
LKRRWEMRKRGLLLLASFVLCTSLFAEEDIPKIGVIDTLKIAEAYLEDSKAMRELLDFREDYNLKSQLMQDEITELESQRLDAKQQDANEDVIRLDALIFEKEQVYNDYVRIMQSEYRRRLNKARLEDSFFGELQSAIAHIAVSEGYSIILEKTDNSILYWVADIDITDEVLTFLLGRR